MRGWRRSRCIRDVLKHILISFVLIPIGNGPDWRCLIGRPDPTIRCVTLSGFLLFGFFPKAFDSVEVISDQRPLGSWKRLLSPKES